MEEIAIEVRYRQQDSKSYFDIRFPKGQPLISIKNSTGILAAGISLLIKAGHKSGEIKDYELLESIIEACKFWNISSCCSFSMFSKIYSQISLSDITPRVRNTTNNGRGCLMRGI